MTEDDEPEPEVVVIRRGGEGRRGSPWNRRPPGGPGIGDSVCFVRYGVDRWGLLADRLAHGTLYLNTVGDSGVGGVKIQPDQVRQWEPGRERSGVPLAETVKR